MGAGELTGRVVRAGALWVTVLAAIAAVMVGVREAAGVAAGGAIALGSFRWLVRDAIRLTAAGDPGRGLLPMGLRQIAAFGGLAVVIGSGWSHPVAVAAGLAVLPPVLVVQGLRAAAR